MLTFALPSLLLLLARYTLAAGNTCYHRDGTVAADGYQPCPGTAYCCRRTDQCTTNGLCQDINNLYPAISSVNLASGGTINATFLYQASTCTNTNFSGCPAQSCPAASTDGTTYIWACNDAVTNFCCKNPANDFTQRSCCSTPVGQFRLDQPIVIPWVSTPTSTSTSSSATSSFTSSTQVSSTGSLASSSSAPANPATDTTASGGMSKGTSTGIGIGVGVAVACLLLIILAYLLYRRFHKRRNNNSINNPLSGSGQKQRYDQVAQHSGPDGTASEAAAQGYYDSVEPRDKSMVVEVDAVPRVHELSRDSEMRRDRAELSC